jgi:hypothetical protein
MNVKGLQASVGCNVALLEYRGYGRSDGSPSEDGMYMDAQVSQCTIYGYLDPGLWIRIDLIRIRIQHFCSIRIRSQAKTELSKTISFSNFFKIKI